MRDRRCGGALAFSLDQGQAHELPHAQPRLEGLPAAPKWDRRRSRGYARHVFLQSVWDMGRKASHPRPPDVAIRLSPVLIGSIPTATGPQQGREALGQAQGVESHCSERRENCKQLPRNPPILSSLSLEQTLTQHSRFARCRKAGVWGRRLEAVSKASDGEIVMIESSFLGVHQHGASMHKERILTAAAFLEPGSPWENGYCESFNLSSAMNYSTARGLTALPRRRSSSRHSGATTRPMAEGRCGECERADSPMVAKQNGSGSDG